MVRVHFSPPQVALCWVTQIPYADRRGYTNKIEPQKARFCEYNFFVDGQVQKGRKTLRTLWSKRPKMYFALRSKAKQTSVGRMYLEN